MQIKFDTTAKILLASAILQCYYMLIQSWLETYTVVNVLWGIANLALVYRVFASASRASSHKK